MYRKKRKDKWFKDHGPCVQCGSWENLEIDHVKPGAKDPILTVHSDRIWQWGERRREAELTKCQVLCYSCHKVKSGKEKSGAAHHSAKLTEIDVLAIRYRCKHMGHSQVHIARDYGVSRTTINRIVNRILWKHI